MTSDQVAAIVAPAELLTEYHQAVNDHTVAVPRGPRRGRLRPRRRRHWDPPVTLMARLVSIEQDAVQHLGQAAYVRGVLRRT